MMRFFWVFIALPPVLNPRRRAMRIALAFDIFAGLTALLIVGLLAGFNIGLVQFGITGTTITGFGNTREYYDLNSALNRVQWKCGTAVAGVVVALFFRVCFLNNVGRPYWTVLQVQHTEKKIKARGAYLMEKVNNKPIRDSIASKQQQLRLEIINGDSGDSIAAEMRSLAKAAVEELKGHLKSVALRYRGITDRKSSLERAKPEPRWFRHLFMSWWCGDGDDPEKQMAERFAFLATIPTEEDWPIQSDVPAHFDQVKYSVETEEAYIHYLRRKAKWLEPRFRELLLSIVEDINECARKCAEDIYASHSEYIAALGVDPEKYSLRISSAFEVARTQVQGNGVVGVKFAPLKDFERCFAKAVSFHGQSWLEHAPAGRYLGDILRATIYAQDPYVISIAFAMFKNRCEGCPRVSNYFMNTNVPPEVQTFINTTFRVVDPDTETEHFAELQFALQDFLTIKEIQHEYYEVLRAGTVDELLARPLGDDHH
jgi:hypothetical protein